MDSEPSASTPTSATALNPIGETSSASGGAVGGSSGGSKEAPRAIIKNVDMSEEMQQEAVDVATQALEKFNIEKDIAQHIKREFDRRCAFRVQSFATRLETDLLLVAPRSGRYGSTWHCVVGKK